MSDKHDSGPAFPCEAYSGMGSSFGMTLRDWFAGQTLAAIGHELDAADPLNCATIAYRSYRIADAMLLQRERIQPIDQEDQ